MNEEPNHLRIPPYVLSPYKDELWALEIGRPKQPTVAEEQTMRLNRAFLTVAALASLPVLAVILIGVPK